MHFHMTPYLFTSLGMSKGDFQFVFESCRYDIEKHLVDPWVTNRVKRKSPDGLGERICFTESFMTGYTKSDFGHANDL